MANLERFAVRATAKSVRRRNLMLKVGMVVLTISVSLLLVFYGFANFADTLGNFTIKINNQTDITGITLSNDSTFENPLI